MRPPPSNHTQLNLLADKICRQFAYCAIAVCVFLATLSGCDLRNEMPVEVATEPVVLEFPPDLEESSRDRAANLTTHKSLLTPGQTYAFRRQIEQILDQTEAESGLVSKSVYRIDYTVTYEGTSLLPNTDAAAQKRIESRRIPDRPKTAPQFRVQFDEIWQQVELPGQPPVETHSSEQQDRAGQWSGNMSLSGNGFRFWLSRTSDVLAIDDLPGFLDRCVGSITDPRERARQRRELELKWGATDAKRFTQELLGISPVLGSKTSDRWSDSTLQTIPIGIRKMLEYSIVSTRGDQRVVRWEGKMIPTNGSNDLASRSTIELESGNVEGHSQIDLRSGLPNDWVQTQIARMSVEPVQGNGWVQTVTTTDSIKLLSHSVDSQDDEHTASNPITSKSTAKRRLTSRRR